MTIADRCWECWTGVRLGGLIAAIRGVAWSPISSNSTWIYPGSGQAARQRPVRLLFTDAKGRPIHDQHWSKLWSGWREAAGWPAEGTFHSLRHYYATALISAGADPTDVQKALRHSSLRITLETYVHWWPPQTAPPKRRRDRDHGGGCQARSRPAEQARTMLVVISLSLVSSTFTGNVTSPAVASVSPGRNY